MNETTAAYLFGWAAGVVSMLWALLIYKAVGRIRSRPKTPPLNSRIKIAPSGRPYVETKDLVERTLKRNAQPSEKVGQ